MPSPHKREWQYPSWSHRSSVVPLAPPFEQRRSKKVSRDRAFERVSGICTFGILAFGSLAVVVLTEALEGVSVCRRFRRKSFRRRRLAACSWIERGQESGTSLACLCSCFSTLLREAPGKVHKYLRAWGRVGAPQRRGLESTSRRGGHEDTDLPSSWNQQPHHGTGKLTTWLLKRRETSTTRTVMSRPAAARDVTNTVGSSARNMRQQ